MRALWISWGVEYVVNALVYRDACADGEDQDGDDEAPEIDFFAVAEGEFFVGGFLRGFQAVEEEALVACVYEGVDAFGEHCRATG